MLHITAARLPSGRLVDVDIDGERITAIHDAASAAQERHAAPPADALRPGLDRVTQRPDGSTQTIDGAGRLLLPGLINTHAHIDKSWWGLPWQSYGGEGGTAGRIAHERARRGELGIPSAPVTRRVVREFLRHGTTAMRTHVDVDLGIGLDGIAAVREAIAAEAPGMVHSIVAFPQDGVLRRPGVDLLLRRAAEEGAEHIGGLDPAGIDRDPAGQIRVLLDISADTGCGLDVHLHDPGELGAFQMDLLMDGVQERGLQGRLTIAHGFAISDVSPDRARGLAERAAELGVSWTTVAPVGRRPLPMRLLREAGVRVGMGTDGIRDLWSPYGDGDMLRIAQQHARMTGTVQDADLRRALAEASSAAFGFVGAEAADPTDPELGIAVGARADLMLLQAENPMDALVRAPRPRQVILAGRPVEVDDLAPWEADGA